MYNCPLWVEREPWVDWACSPKFTEPFRPPEERRRVARDTTADALNATTIGSRKGKNLMQHVVPEVGRLQKTVRKTKWVPIIRKDQKAFTSEEFQEANQFNALRSLLNEDATSTEPNLAVQQDVINYKTDEEVVNASNVVHSYDRLNAHLGRIPLSNYSLPKTPILLNRKNISSSPPFSEVKECPDNSPPGNCFMPENSSPPEENLLALCPFSSTPEMHSFQKDNNEDVLICSPLVTVEPDDNWHDQEETLLLEKCGSDQKKISAWVLNRMKSFKKILGFSCDGFEDQLMELLKSIEMKRELSKRTEGKKQSRSTRRGVRELRNLQCSISYDKGGLVGEAAVFREEFENNLFLNEA